MNKNFTINNYQFEIWKPFPKLQGQFADIIEISNYGRYRRKWKNHYNYSYGASHGHNDGHKQLVIKKNGKIYKFMLHKLVAELFIHPLSSSEVTHHRDFNPSNNQVSNLEILTRSQHIKLHKTWTLRKYYNN